MRVRLYLVAAVVLSILVGIAAVVSTSPADERGDEDHTPANWAIPRRPAGAPQQAQAPTPAPAPPVVPSPTPEPAGPRLDLTAEVDVAIDGFLRWAALDRQSGELVTSGNRTSTAESMIKAWIAADFLRLTAEAGEEPDDAALDDASRAIRDSHDGAAERLYLAAGDNAVVERMIDMCGLTHTEVYPYFWSRTRISAADAVRVGECIADGTAAGPEWTDWVLEEMRRVRGTTAREDQSLPGGGEGGRWGIIDGLPEEVVEAGVAIKNGWTAIGRTGNWHVVCLAITEEWVMAVVMQYPARRSLDYGAQRCADVAAQLVVGPPEPSPAPFDLPPDAW